MSPLDWRADAACADHDPELWYATDNEGITLARTICRDECPVRATCLTRALDEEADTPASMRWGVRGDTLPAERARFARHARRERAKPAPVVAVDEVNVARRAAGDRGVYLTRADRRAVVALLLREGLGRKEIERRTGINTYRDHPPAETRTA